MSKITFYVGLNVQALKFECGCGGGPKGFSDGVVRYGVDETHRHLIEQGLHPRKVAEKVLQEVQYCEGNWDLHISTNSDIPLNLIGLMIHECKVRACDVKIIGLSDDNKTIQFESTYHPDGYFENWPYGFLDFDYSAAKRAVGMLDTLGDH